MADLELTDRVLDLVHFFDETVLDGVATQLDVGATGAVVEACLRHHQRRFLRDDRLLYLVDVVLHLLDLLQDLQRWNGWALRHEDIRARQVWQT